MQTCCAIQRTTGYTDLEPLAVKIRLFHFQYLLIRYHIHVPFVMHYMLMVLCTRKLLRSQLTAASIDIMWQLLGIYA